MDYRNAAGLSNASAITSAVAESNNQMDVDDPDSESDIRDEGFSLQAVGILNPSPVVPSIDDDDGVDFDDDAEDDKKRGRKRVRRKRTDFMWKYMGVLQERFRKES